MCGIVGYVGRNEAVPILLEGLRRLEYRGYDSAGVATLEEGVISVRKEIGRIDVPERPLQILFGGADGRTLFILTHHALYAVRT